MSVFQAILLSIVEGLTEFLPISSTGHLILASQILNIPENEYIKTFEIAIQLGAILAVIFLYWKTLVKNIELWKKILVAFIPTGVLGFVLYKFIKHYLLGNSWVVVISLIVGGIILILFEKLITNKKPSARSPLTYKNAFLIGVAQSFSMIPGVSRAAATIVGAMLLGLDRTSAVEFSFLLAVPTMAAATGLDLLKSNLAFTGNEILLLLIGTLGAFVTAAITIKFFIKFVQKNNFVGFGIYRIIVALLFILLVLR